MDGFEVIDIAVGDERVTVALAETAGQRSQGLQGLDELPGGVDGMLFVFEEARTASFHMRTVGFDLDIWWFDDGASLIGSTDMSTCLDGDCVSYPSPGQIKWALETPAGERGFAAGASLSVPD